MPFDRFDIDRSTLPVNNVEMLPLLFAMIVFAFLLLGSLVFLVSVLIPQTRRFALSAALWCALWGPCSVAFMVLAGLGLVAAAFISRDRDVYWFHAPRLVATFGWGYFILGVLITAVVATSGAWLHHVLVRRFTFALFRLYVTIVSAGIGSVFAWSLGWWLLWKEVTPHVLPWWTSGMLILIAGFGAAAYKGASGLRGDAPTNFTWLSPEEFTGQSQ